jgi:hypothetical protein
VVAALLAITAAACSDRANPVTPTPSGPGGEPSKPLTVQALACRGDRGKLTLSCAPAGPEAGGPAGNITVGGQNVNVKVTSSNVAYNSGTGQFTFDVTVQNLIEQPMGTVDGTTLDPGGVRVFFSAGPTVTSGTGIASVLPDGFGTFTAAGQAFYQYNQVLVQNATSSARTWTLIMPPTVGTFDFLLYISAPVQFPDGYITLDGNLPGASYGNLHPGDTHPLTAVVKNQFGAVQGGTVTFGTTNGTCATVDGSGVVTGVQYATCSITATAGARSGSLSFDVTGTTRNWTGAVSSDWSIGGNWAGGLIPAVTDSVLIPTGVPNFPVLSTPVTISNVTVADLAMLDLASFNLTSTGDVATGPTVGWGVLASGSGALLLTGNTKTMHGRFPTVTVSGSYALDGQYWGKAPQTVDSGIVQSDSYELDIDQ